MAAAPCLLLLDEPATRLDLTGDRGAPHHRWPGRPLRRRAAVYGTSVRAHLDGRPAEHAGPHRLRSLLAPIPADRPTCGGLGLDVSVGTTPDVVAEAFTRRAGS